MILTGAGRSVAVKLFYQLGFCNPLFVTLLYLTGQGLSLIVYFVQKMIRKDGLEEEPCHDVLPTEEVGDMEYGMVELHHAEGGVRMDDDDSFATNPSMDEKKDDYDDNSNYDEKDTKQRKGLSIKKNWFEGKHKKYNAIPVVIQNDVDEHADDMGPMTMEPPHDVFQIDDDDDDDDNDDTNDIESFHHETSKDDFSIVSSLPNKEKQQSPQLESSLPLKRLKLKRRGSKTGLTTESTQAVAWVHKIPTNLKPAIPGFFNVVNSAMRWASLVFVAASTAEMLISGLELILSTVAARLIRKRLVSKMRWMGVVVVALGLVLVRIADSSGGDADASGDDNMDASMSGNGMNNYSITTTNDEGGLSDNNTATTTNSANYNRLIGDVLIIGQCIMSVIQDIAEEIFMQESDFPPALLPGMEGCFGL